jgi:alpha-mannosidase
VLRLHPDHPIWFDAWDVDAPAFGQYTEVTDLQALDVIEEGPLIGAIKVHRRLGKESAVEQTYVLRAGSRRLEIVTEVDWHESDALLTVAFPVDVRSDECRYGIQFGHVGRPVHENTSWDAARFEVAAHGWAHLAEAGFGVAVLDDGIYGHGCQGNVLRLSLLRAPGFPDPAADRGQHRMTYALMGTDGRLDDVIEEAHRLQTPLRVVRGSSTTLPEPLVAVSGACVSAIKRADDDPSDLIVRCWEPRGGRATLHVEASVDVSAQRCDALERPTEAEANNSIDLAPFELTTLRLRPRRHVTQPS